MEANEHRARNYTRPMTRPGELAKAWRNEGLQDVVETSLGIRMEFTSFEDYWAPYGRRGGTRWAKHLAPAQQHQHSRG
jgi:hypothetical protein